MTPLIKKARKGSREALTELYCSNKEYVYLLCNLLLCDRKSAEHACVQAFKNGWEYLLGGNIEAEREFTDFVVKKAVNHCKNKITKSESKAFKIPTNKNFSVTPYAKEDVVKDENACVQILVNLPPLQRFIYVLRLVGKWSDEEIAELIHAKPDTVEAALAAEQVNIERIADAIRQKTGVEEFHALLEAEREESRIPYTVDSAVTVSIGAIADPVEARAKKKMMTVGLVSIVSVILVVVLIFGIVAIVRNSESGEPIDSETESDKGADDDKTTEPITWLTEVENPTHYAIMDIADYGQITLALDGSSAPETVENFVTLAEEGFYEGLTFHRIIEGFVMQGGDPNGNGTGGNEDENGNEINIRGEFYYNGFENRLSHVRGAISMARAADYNSASSQFFIVHKDNVQKLDRLYAAFGYVIEGMDVVDAICESAEPLDNNGTIAVKEQPVITSVTIYTPEEYEQLVADSTPEVEPVASDPKVAEFTVPHDGVLLPTKKEI